MNHETTDKFLNELKEVLKKHKLAILPSYGGRVSFHDTMLIVPYSTQEEIDNINNFIDYSDLAELEIPE